MSTPNGDPDQAVTARFVQHVVGMSEQAIIFLGHAPNPFTGKTEAEPELAREVIDHLEMLETKTRGNLDKDETRILRDILTRLRLAYAANQGGVPRGGAGAPGGADAHGGETPADDHGPAAGASVEKTAPATGGGGRRNEGTDTAAGPDDDARVKFHKSYD